MPYAARVKRTGMKLIRDKFRPGRRYAVYDREDSIGGTFDCRKICCTVHPLRTPSAPARSLDRVVAPSKWSRPGRYRAAISGAVLSEGGLGFSILSRDRYLDKLFYWAPKPRRRLRLAVLAALAALAVSMTFRWRCFRFRAARAGPARGSAAS